ncbi:MAG: hypothetical protein WAN50_01355 [Minisyncoccia bacterium]
MEKRDAWFFIWLFAFIFLVWIFIGGPLRSVFFPASTIVQSSGTGTNGSGTSGSSGFSFSNWFSGLTGGGRGIGGVGGSNISLPGASVGGSGTSTGNRAGFALPQAPFGIGSTYISLPGSSNGGGSYAAGTSGGTQLPTLSGGAIFGTPSLYRGIVSLSHSVSGAGSSDPKNENIALHVSQNGGIPVDLTGWTLVSDATGNSAVIPKGTEVPMSGIVNAAQDIVLTPGESAILISGQSPIGASFRENKCIGYFSTFQKFSPALPQDCPSPSSEFDAYYGGIYIRDAACINYVNALSRCQVVLSPPANLTSACQSVLVNHLNYNGCVNSHQNDTDFEGDTWRIYLGRTNSMWRSQHEVVKLLDKSGNTVDAFSY